MLEATSLTIAYGRSRPPILVGCSISLKLGELVAITGPSGCGKSTLLFSLGLMLTPQAGEITVGGIPTSKLRDSRRARMRAECFGFVFQDAALDPRRTVLDNVVEPATYQGVRRADRIEAASELLDRLGVNLRADHRPTQISGGQAQRVATCRALLHQPAIVLADEPTGNLDPISANAVIDALTAHARSGAAVAIVTHDAAVVARCDRSVQLQ
jgi:ABC-type lipoprotein export system ATPase subunit